MKTKRKYSSQEKNIIKKIKTRRKHVCYYCEKKITEKHDLTVDHKEPYDGFNTTYRNCVISCFKCNNEKQKKTEQEYSTYLLYKDSLSKFSIEKIEEELERIVNLFREGIKVELDGMPLGHKAQALRAMKDSKKIA
ncbi:gp381 [Bacillus phage G]|uniref:Gp381 n=1 Tax=Bacillus phage G TaxID=2884420 RepID=G3MAC2_9CAUD|nr:gp381 [Bacillus phage G]AEO93640.1 gp381 [Bacillus phage G]